MVYRVLSGSDDVLYRLRHIRALVDHVAEVGAGKALRSRPCEQRHAQSICDVPEQHVGTVFLGRVEVDQTLSRADQQLDVVEGVLRHLDSSSAKSQPRIVHSLFRDWRAISARGDHFAW